MQKSPTQKQIRSRCKKIQESWSEEERIRRIADYRLRPDYMDTWSIPVFVISQDEVFEEYLERKSKC